MTSETRATAEAALEQVAQEYENAQAALKAAEEKAQAAARDAKLAGLSQHDIARVMGPVWASDHNPQYAPVLNLQPPATAADDGDE